MDVTSTIISNRAGVENESKKNERDRDDCTEMHQAPVDETLRWTIKSVADLVSMSERLKYERVVDAKLTTLRIAVAEAVKTERSQRTMQKLNPEATRLDATVQDRVVTLALISAGLSTERPNRSQENDEDIRKPEEHKSGADADDEVGPELEETSRISEQSLRVPIPTEVVVQQEMPNLDAIKRQLQT